MTTLMAELVMAEENNVDRHIWTEEETRALLSVYAARAHELQHVRNRKFAFANMLEDLIGLGVLKSPVTALQLDNKIKNMLRAFKSAADNSMQSGASPSVKSPFYEEMEELFGTRPIINRKHSINSSAPIALTNSTNLMDRSGPSRAARPSPIKISKRTPKQKINRMGEIERSRSERYQDKKALLLFLNEERNKRHAELISVLSAMKK